ncbi:hypothetical protein D4R71_00465 [bacterium]|nr:MAG: hypothetical protein D4R71_00465 [bacterium]
MDWTKEAKEIWKPVKGYEGLYEVSSIGRMRSLNRIVFCRARSLRIVQGRHLLQTLNTKGYLRVNLGQQQNFKTKEVHRLVALAFIPNPLNKPWVNHKNGHKEYNWIGNLEWTTPAENNQHAQDTGLNRARFSLKQKEAARRNGIKSRKATPGQVADIIALRKYGYGARRIAKIVHTTEGTIESIIYRKRYKEVVDGLDARKN